MEHASSPEFKQRIAEAHREQMRNCKQFRGLLSSNVVRVFDKWLASSAQVLTMFFSYHAAEAGMMSLFF
jgi:hypothetical protein